MAIRAEVIRAVVRFCEESLVWKSTEQEALDVVAGQSEYTVPVPAGLTSGDVQVVHVNEAFYNGVRLPAITENALKEMYQDWRTQTGTPRHRTQTEPNSIRLVPIPEAADALTNGLTVEATYKPAMTATAIPNFIFNQYGFAIAAGALASLLSMPGRTWFNGELAGYYAQQYRSAVIAARTDASKNFTTATLRVRRKFI